MGVGGGRGGWEAGVAGWGAGEEDIAGCNGGVAHARPCTREREGFTRLKAVAVSRYWYFVLILII